MIVQASKAFLLLILVVLGIGLFVLQTLHVYVYRYEQNIEKIESTKYRVDELSYPNIVICNKFPFTQAGMNSLGLNSNQEYVLRYLIEWLNPSRRQDPDYLALPDDQLQLANGMVPNSFNGSQRTERLATIMLQCQEFVNDCKFQGVSLAPFECCNMFFRPMTGTLEGGICWLFNHNNTISQSALDLNKGLELTFSIARNSYSNMVRTHPGIDIYLVDGNLEPLRLATELQEPVNLKDRQGVRVRMHKEYESNLKSLECGSSSTSAKSTDTQEFHSKGPAYVLCLLEAVVHVCECLPLFAYYVQLGGNVYNDFEHQLNSTELCSVQKYEQCAKPYMEYAKLIYWYEEPSSRLDSNFKQEISNCKKNFRPCQRVFYNGPVDRYELPIELTQNTQDFMAKLTIVYETLLVTDTVKTRTLTLYEFLSFIGYNIALWFCIGHIIWSILTSPCDWFGRNPNRVAPKVIIPPRTAPSPILHIRNPQANRQQLAPVDSNPSQVQVLSPEQI